MKHLKEFYDNQHDVMYFVLGEGYSHSEELFEGKVIIDRNKKNQIIGFRIFDFEKELIKGRLRINKLFKDHDLKQK